MMLTGLPAMIDVWPDGLYVRSEPSTCPYSKEGDRMWWGGYAPDLNQFGPFPRLIDVLREAIEKEKERSVADGYPATEG